MRAEKASYALLNGAAGVTAITGARLFGGGLPQDTAPPALTYELISDVPVRTLAARITGEIWEARIQVTAWDDDYAGLKALLEQVRLAMSYQGGAIGGVTVIAVLPDITGPDLRDDAVGLFYQSQDFLITYQV